MWMLTNKLKLNDSKTEFIVLVNKHNQSFIYAKSLVLRAGEAGIPPNMKVRNVGVIFYTAHYDHQWCSLSTILCQHTISIPRLSVSSEIT